jgi:hypothetical protein
VALDAGKTGFVTASRLPLLALAVGNFHMLVVAAVWAAGNIAGLETAEAGTQLALNNPVYLIVLVLACWLLLTPYFEAGNYLIYVDWRTRGEGLDLLVRVRRGFAGGRAGKGGLVAAVTAAFALGGVAQAADPDQAGNPPRLSREAIKQLIREKGPASGGRRESASRKEREQQRKDREVQRDDDAPRRAKRRGSGAALAPAGGGLGPLGWAVLGGAAVAVLVVAGALFLTSRKQSRPVEVRRESGESAVADQVVALPHEQPAAVWWRQADELARAGRFPEAARAAYLAVLSLLHRRGLVRCEPTRTNGEYVIQARLAPEAPDELHAPFEDLTARFEVLWYGGAACGPDEYRGCRALSERLRDMVR